MLFLKITSILFLILLFPLAMILTAILRLKFKSLSPADVALPLYACALYLISAQTFYHSLIPLYLLLIISLLMGMAIFFLTKNKTFRFRRIFKIFWRLSFLLTILFYLALVIYILVFA